MICKLTTLGRQRQGRHKNKEWEWKRDKTAGKKKCKHNKDKWWMDLKVKLGELLICLIWILFKISTVNTGYYNVNQKLVFSKKKKMADSRYHVVNQTVGSTGIDPTRDSDLICLLTCYHLWLWEVKPWQSTEQCADSTLFTLSLPRSFTAASVAVCRYQPNVKMHKQQDQVNEC